MKINQLCLGFEMDYLMSGFFLVGVKRGKPDFDMQRKCAPPLNFQRTGNSFNFMQKMGTKSNQIKSKFFFVNNLQFIRGTPCMRAKTQEQGSIHTYDNAEHP